MSCPNNRFDTENLFTGNTCNCSQNGMEVEDWNRLRYGNNSGFPRIADRDIWNFQIAQNGPHNLDSVSGVETSWMRYYPGVARGTENPSKQFSNLGYTSPTQWKHKPERPEHRPSPPPPQTSGETKKESYTTFSSAPAQYNGVPYGDEQFDTKFRKGEKIKENFKDLGKKIKEGWHSCGCGKRPEKKYDIPICVITGIIIVIIIIAIIFKSRKPKDSNSTPWDSLNNGDFPFN